MSDDATPLAKAELRQLDADFKEEIEPKTWTKVQFNPETLKVSFANQVQQPSGGGDQRGTPSQQFVGAGTTKLSVQLWFDVTAPLPEGEQAVRFVWGTFQFDGIMDSMEESLELFSAEGRPLRASVSFGLSQQKITAFVFAPAENPPPGTGKPAGTTPMTPAPDNSTVQGMAASQGKGGNWQDIASANGIENPRRLAPGQLVDMQAGRNVGVRR